MVNTDITHVHWIAKIALRERFAATVTTFMPYMSMVSITAMAVANTQTKEPTMTHHTVKNFEGAAYSRLQGLLLHAVDKGW